jgi:hypothetical protein
MTNFLGQLKPSKTRDCPSRLPGPSTPSKGQKRPAEGSKCSFSPRSFYKSKPAGHAGSGHTGSGPPEKVSRKPAEPFVQISIVKENRRRSDHAGSKSSDRNLVKQLLRSDPKLAHKALVKIPKLPHPDKRWQKRANNEAIKCVTESMVQARVSPVKTEKSPDVGGSRSVWHFPTPAAHAALPSKAPSPSKLLRPAILNVPPSPKLELKSEPASGTFSMAAASTAASSSNNPFLPASTDAFKKSSFLFGRDSDFQPALGFDSEEVDNVLYIDDDEDDDDESSNDSEAAQPKRPSNESGHKSPEHIFGSGLFSAAHGDTKTDLRAFLFNTFAAAKAGDPKPAPEPKPEVAAEPRPEVSPTCNKIRFPAVPGSNNLIPCKWRDCDASFTAYGKLSDHLKVIHYPINFYPNIIQ